MKSKFAKFVDSSLGACLIFFAAAAIFRYYTTPDLAVFCALSVTACACLLLKLRSKKRCAADTLTAAAENMFFEFMFLPDDAPAKLLFNGLKTKYANAVRHGTCVVANKTAAYCSFNTPITVKAAARMIAKAKRYGAQKIVMLSKTPPELPELDGITVKAVFGNDVYKLFGSLACLPPTKYAAQKRKRHSALVGAMSKDKIIRYALLSGFFFAATAIGRSLITFICAIAAAALAVAAIAVNAVRAVKSRSRGKV